MDNERRNKLDQTLKGFNKKHKSEIFTMGNKIESLPVISSGIKIFDEKIGGGFKKGGHTIVWGMYSVGKTALILTTIANAQRNGMLVCYVNTEKPIEPERFKFFGINLDDMVYIEAPENAEQALEAMRTLCREKVIDLFVIDSTNGLCPKSVQEEKAGKERSLEKKNVASLALTLSNFYNIVNSYVFKSRASIIWIGQGRTQGIGSFFTRMGLSGGNAQEFYAYQIMFMRRGQNSDAPVTKKKIYSIDDGKLRYKTVSEAIGFDICFKLEKTNSSKSILEKKEFHIPYYYATGFKAPVNNDSIPIDVQADTDKERDLVWEMMAEKGITAPKKPEPTEPINHSPVMENIKEPIETKEDTLINEKSVKKKGRGRPKKKKNA